MRPGTLISAVVLVALTLTVGIEACEKDCRKGISKAFSDHYTEVTGKLFTDFASKLRVGVLANVDGTLLGPKKAEIRADVKRRMNKISATFNKELASTFASDFENDIFRAKKEPFVGQCQHPLRVKQPKQPPWPRDSCEKQDYICGNPPSICHFLQSKVKPRLFNRVKSRFVERSAKYSARLMVEVKSACANAKKREAVLDIAQKNVNGLVKDFSKKFTSSFCKDGCKQFDEDIITKLLSFP